MPLKRISAQKRQTIEEFFFEVIKEQQDSPWKGHGESMSNLIIRLNQVFQKEIIWCLTSLYQLVLLSEDSWESNWNVIISCSPTKEFRIEYAIPELLSQCEHETIQRTAHSIDTAVEYILAAMSKSKGWPQLPYWDH